MGPWVKETCTVTRERMTSEGWGLVRDVIRLFMDHHTFKIAQTEATGLQTLITRRNHLGLPM